MLDKRLARLAPVGFHDLVIDGVPFGTPAILWRGTSVQIGQTESSIRPPNSSAVRT